MLNQNNNGRRLGVIAIALSTIGVISIVLVILFFLTVAFAMHTVSGSLKNIVSTPSVHKSSGGTKINYTVPLQNLPYIAGIKLTGEITHASADEVLDKLNTAQEDSAAVGVLFEVNSPGGAVVPSQEIYDKIKVIRATKPVVVYVREMAASGAYYSSSSATKIVANRGSLIGSIGVIMQGFEADKLIQFLKINPITIKTGALKDTGSPTRSMNDSDKKYLQGLIDATRAEFVADVKNGRGTSDEAMNFMSDGRVILAPQALELKLIDGIGTKDLALAEITKLAKQKKTPELYYYENINSLSDILAQNFSSSVTNIFTSSLTHILNSNRTEGLKAE